MDVAEPRRGHACPMTPHLRTAGWLIGALALVVAAVVSALTIGWFAPVLLAIAAVVAASIWLVRLRQSFRSF